MLNHFIPKYPSTQMIRFTEMIYFFAMKLFNLNDPIYTNDLFHTYDPFDHNGQFYSFGPFAY